MSSIDIATTTAQIIENHDKYLSPNYPRFDKVMVRGDGSRLWDADGNEYLDLFSGFGATVLGHCHPALVQAVTHQARSLWHVGNLLHTQPQVEAAQWIAKLAFGGKTFFSHSGADANETAIKLARLYGKTKPNKATGEFGRYKVISATQSFHGRSFATMGATGQDKVRLGFEPLLPGFCNVAYNDLVAIEEAMDGETVAVIVEPIQGEGGINVPDADYLPNLRKLCDERDVILICDEVWCAGGRTGKPFAYQHWDFEPDILTMGKGVGGGLPVGAVHIRACLAELFDARKHGVKHATTLGGNCLSMAACAAVFRTIADEKLAERAVQLGQQISEQIMSQAEQVPAIQNVRGKGLFLGIELDVKQLPEGVTSAMDIVKGMLDRGILIGSAQTNILRIAPALTIPESQLLDGIDRLLDYLKNS